jgi:dTMP kinase
MIVAIEGIDGSGKHTQATLVKARAEAAGIPCYSFSFPQYSDNAFGRAVGWYLNGRFGETSHVSPYLAAVLYAGDRFTARKVLLDLAASSALVICDRYVPSNIAHQAAKLAQEDRSELITWLEEIEYGIFQMPRADLTLLLRVPVATAVKMVRRKRERTYTTSLADHHERDEPYLRECSRVYDQLSRAQSGSRWDTIECESASGELRDPHQINDDIWESINQRLGEFSP